MAAAAFIPQHQLSEADHSRTIDIGGWTITATTRPIINATETDSLQKLSGFPLPEMTFGNNSLTLTHKSSGWQYRFDTVEALKGVKNAELVDGDGGVKVGYAEAWLKSRTEPGSMLPLPTTVPTKPYDWTYTTTYPGHVVPTATLRTDFTSKDGTDPDQTHAIPMAELTRPDPILFYAEIPLFEDELHDNGSSHLLVRIRIMPGCIFILSRFTLRVDNVLFRAFDTRIYHSFKSSPPLVVRETCGWEAPYDDVKRHLTSKDDLTPLTDPNFIAKTLGSLPTKLSQEEGAGTRWRALGTKSEFVYLSPD